MQHLRGIEAWGRPERCPACGREGEALRIDYLWASDEWQCADCGWVRPVRFAQRGLHADDTPQDTPRAPSGGPQPAGA